MGSKFYLREEVEIGKVDSERLLRSLVIMVQNAIKIEKKNNFTIEKYIPISIENLVGLLEQSKEVKDEEDKRNRIICLLDFMAVIELKSKEGQVFKPVKNISLQADFVYFLLDVKILEII